MTRSALLLACASCVLLLVGAGALLLLSAGEGDGDAETAPPRVDAGVEYVDEPPGRVCQALPSFDNDRLRLRQFMRDVRRLTDRPRVPVAWLIDADTTGDKDELARSLSRAAFSVETGRFESGSWLVTAQRRTRLDLPALAREKKALLRASSARSDRTVLMVAYPGAGCEDVGPDG